MLIGVDGREPLNVRKKVSEEPFDQLSCNGRKFEDAHG